MRLLRADLFATQYDILMHGRINIRHDPPALSKRECTPPARELECEKVELFIYARERKSGSDRRGGPRGEGQR